MNNNAHAGSSNDPFAAIQNTEGSAEKSIEKEMQRNAEALAEAKNEREELLKTYEDELRAEGMGKLKEVKGQAMEQMEADLKSARSEAENLKNKAADKMKDAVQLITDAFKNNVAA